MYFIIIIIGIIYLYIYIIPKGNNSWVFFGRTDTESETPIFLLKKTVKLKMCFIYSGKPKKKTDRFDYMESLIIAI